MLTWSQATKALQEALAPHTWMTPAPQGGPYEASSEITVITKGACAEGERKALKEAGGHHAEKGHRVVQTAPSFCPPFLLLPPSSLLGDESRQVLLGLRAVLPGRDL